MHAGSIPRWDTFFLVFLYFHHLYKFLKCFLFEYHYPNVIILYNLVRRYACRRVHKTHNGHAFMISMNESKVYKRVHVTVYILVLFLVITMAG